MSEIDDQQIYLSLSDLFRIGVLKEIFLGIDVSVHSKIADYPVERETISAVAFHDVYIA